MIGRLASQNLTRITRINSRTWRLNRTQFRYNSDKSKDQTLFDEELSALLGSIPKEAPKEMKQEVKTVPDEEIQPEEDNQPEENEEFNLLNDFINKEYEQDTGFKGIIESLNLNDIKTEDVDEFKVNVDKSDETVFDLDFLGMDKKAKEEKKDIEEEKQLFQNIFESYMKPLDEGRNEKNKIMWNLRDSVHSTKDKIDRMVHSRRSVELSKVSIRLRNEMFSKTREALKPTLNYIDTLDTSGGLVEYFDKTLASWLDLSSQPEKHESFYLDELLKGSKDFSNRHQQYVESIRTGSAESPGTPELNVITLPILINQMIKTAAFKFHDGQLSYTLFNLLKKDVGLYTVACNQETYNEVLRVLWIYHGKSNLYNIEMAFMEMKNNGFNGDFVTFNILKQIIIDYHNLKMGKLDLNKETGLPIWSNEDDKRVRTLEGKLRGLAESLA